MRRVLKWIGIILGGLVGLVILAAIVLYIIASVRLNRTYEIEPEAVAIPTDKVAIERGRHWVRVHCTSCHGEDLSGTVFFKDPTIGQIEASNLTSGRGGIGGTYSVADWVRAIRHGISPDGKPLVAMPSESFYYLSNKDLGEVIAHLKTVTPVDKKIGGYVFTPLARVLVAAGIFRNAIPAELIEHTGPRPPAPKSGVTASYGKYLVDTGGCRTCHGRDLSGGTPPDPNSPRGPNLTPGGELREWSEKDFIAAMRTGVTPEDHELDNKYMPWKSIARMTDAELKAVWLQLESLPAVAGDEHEEEEE